MRKYFVRAIVGLYFVCLLVTSDVGILTGLEGSEVHAKEAEDMYADEIRKLPIINEETVKERIVELCYAMGIYDVDFQNLKEKKGRMFTVDGDLCASHKGYGDTCPNCCNIDVISKETWLKDAIINKEGERIELPIDPENQLPISYSPNNRYFTSGSYTCIGFSHFASWYLFREDEESVVYPREQKCATEEKTIYATKALRKTYTLIDDIDFTLNNDKKIRDAGLRIGDVVSLRYGSSAHEMIFLEYREDGILGLDCNGAEKRTVAIHLWKYDRKPNDKITVTRTPNYQPDYVYPAESVELYHYTDGEKQYSYCADNIVPPEEGFWSSVLNWIVGIFAEEESFIPQKEVRTFAYNELAKAENIYGHKAHAGCDIADGNIVEYLDKNGVVWYQCEVLSADSNATDKPEEPSSSGSVENNAGNSAGNTTDNTDKNAAGNATDVNKEDVIEDTSENKGNSSVPTDGIELVGNEMVQYRYHHYTNGTRYCVCPTYGKENWKEKEIWREDTGWLKQPLEHTKTVQHTRVSGCEGNGCQEGSWVGKAYKDSNGVVWYREETRKVSIGYHYTDGNGNYSYCADELSSPLKKDKYFVPTFVKSELDLSTMQKQDTITHKSHAEDYCPIWDCSMVEYKDSNNVIWYVIVVDAASDVSDVQSTPKEKEQYIEIPNVTVKEPEVYVDSEKEKNETNHHWMSATCTAAQTCSECGATTGTELGHLWSEATCYQPKTCMVCNVTEGSELGHSYYDDGSCEYCTRCGWVNATWSLVEDWTTTALVAGVDEKVETCVETKTQYQWTRALAWSNYGGKPHSIAGSNSHMEGLGLIFNGTYVAVGDSDVYRTVTTGAYSEGKKGKSNGTYCRQATGWSDSDTKPSGYYNMETATVEVILYRKYQKSYR